MIYNFDTSSRESAVGAFLVYVVYRSRDHKRFKISPEMWSTIERAVKSVSKRAEDLGEFIEKLKPKLACSSIKPKWAKTVPDGMVMMMKGEDGVLFEIGHEGIEKRQFLTDVLETADDRAVLDVLYKKAAYVVLLVRDRLERERPYEAQFEAEDAEDVDADAL